MHCTCVQVCGTQMGGLSHEQAVGVLKATPMTVQMKIEKGALPEDSHISQRNSVEVQVLPCMSVYTHLH